MDEMLYITLLSAHSLELPCLIENDCPYIEDLFRYLVIGITPQLPGFPIGTTVLIACVRVADPDTMSVCSEWNTSLRS
jgi:hypothetical protein